MEVISDKSVMEEVIPQCKSPVIVLKRINGFLCTYRRLTVVVRWSIKAAIQLEYLSEQ